MKEINIVLDIISELTFCYNNRSCQQKCDLCQVRIAKIVKRFINNNKTIEFVLPAFPAKSANRNKTISELPDLGELIALKRLNHMLKDINKSYKPGAKLIICSDGHVFNDIVKVPTGSVTNYQHSLKNHCKQHGYNDISFFDLSDNYPNQSITRIREKLVMEHGESLAKIKNDVAQIQDEKIMFNGLHRFLFEDINFFYPELSKNKIKKLAKDSAYQTIQRSHAWSTLVKIKYPLAIRLSIHPHVCSENKLSIKLIESNNHWATPWHNVVLKTKQGVKLIKRHQAIKMGGKLIAAGSSEAHYAL